MLPALTIECVRQGQLRRGDRSKRKIDSRHFGGRQFRLRTNCIAGRCHNVDFRSGIFWPRSPHHANGPEPLHDPEEFSLLLNRYKDHISRCRLISNRERNEHPQLRTSELLNGITNRCGS